MTTLREPWHETLRGKASDWSMGVTKTKKVFGAFKVDGTKVQVWQNRADNGQPNPDFDVCERAAENGEFVMVQAYCKDRAWTFEGKSGVKQYRTVNAVQIIDASDVEQTDASDVGTGGERRGSTPSSADAPSRSTFGVRESLIGSALVAGAQLAAGFAATPDEAVQVALRIARELLDGCGYKSLLPEARNGAQRESATTVSPSVASNTAPSGWRDDEAEANLSNGFGAVEEVPF